MGSSVEVRGGTLLKLERDNIILQQLREKIKPGELTANDLSRIKGVSNWLTMLQLKSENFLFNRENPMTL